MSISDEIVNGLRRDLLGGYVEVVQIKDTRSGKVSRCLLRSKPAEQLIGDYDKDDYQIYFFAQHTQMCTELIANNYKGPFAFEVPITTLYDCIELYRSMAFAMLKNEIALKLHIIMVDDMPDFSGEALLSELAELVALGVELIIDNVSTEQHLMVAQTILSVVEEVRMDLSAKNAMGYIHLNALLSTEVSKARRFGVILPKDYELPPFAHTYQRNDH
jgi:hypothetical protein